MNEPETVLPRVAVIHAPFGAAGLPEIFAAADGACKILIMIREEVADSHPETVDFARRVGDVVVADTARLTTLAADRGVAGVTTFHDRELEHADDIATHLALPSAPRLANPWDKLAQRRRWADHGCSTLRALGVDSVTEFCAAVAKLGYPAVLKPRRGVSGSGIAFIDEESDAEYQKAYRGDWRGLMLEQRIPRGQHPQGESWLGDYVSVETLSTGTERHHVGVTDWLPISVARRAMPGGADSVCITGAITPSSLSGPERGDVLEAVSRALDALNVTWRVTHTEVQLISGSPEVVEVNGRVGGYLERQMRSTGRSSLVRAALLLAAGLRAQARTGDESAADCAAFCVPAFPDRGGPVCSDVSRAELRRIASVLGVDDVARHGEAKSATDYRLARFMLRAEGRPAIGGKLGAAMGRLGALFAADGFDIDPWRRQFDVPEAL